jgi:ParB/RepB/Spo0J family partition protein
MKIPIEKIIVSKDNPRQTFDEDSLRRLGESIKTYGQLQPIVVRQHGSDYELVVGERRLRASTIIGLTEIEAVVKDVDDSTALELKLIENTQREDLSDAEKGDAVLALWANYDKYNTIKDVANAINMPYKLVVSHWVRKANKLSEKVKNLVKISSLPEDASYSLATYPHSIQEKLADAIIKYDIRRTKAGEQPQYREFLKLYNQNPSANLEELANKVKGTQTVETITVPKDKIPKEVLEKLDDEKKQLATVQRIRKKPSRSITKEDVRKRQKKTKPDIPLLPEETEVREPIESENPVHKDVEQITQEVSKIIRETVNQVPEKEGRVSEIVREELREFQRGLGNRLEIFPDKSAKIEPKFDQLRLMEERGVIPYTVWDFQYRDDYAGDKDFHGNCSPQIVEQCIWRLTNEGDLVVDPMAGSGTTLDVCRRFNRKSIGYDINPPKNRQDIIQNNSQKIPLDSNFVDMIFIHPPYWNIAYYTKAEENLPDLSRAKSPNEFMAMLEQVFQECYRVLKPNKFLCVLLGDVIREGKFIPLCRKTTDIAEKIGFIDYGYAVKLAHGEVSRKKSGVIVAEPIYTGNLKISHDLVMFFKKE